MATDTKETPEKEMCDGENGPDLVKPAPKQATFVVYEETDASTFQPLKVSQGTQVGSVNARVKQPRVLYPQNYATTDFSSPRGYTRRPFYTSRSGQPLLDPLSFPSYVASANRAKRKFLSYSGSSPNNNSPTSSLDCLTLKDVNWNPDSIINSSMGKINGGFSLGALDGHMAATSTASNKSCRCNCHCNGMNSINTIPQDGGTSVAQTTEGLSLRRLHMSRAKLKATSTTSELLSGFAMIAMVELQINDPTNVPEWLFVMFAVCTTILVAVHIFALMISTYLLPNIDAVSKMSAGEILKESPHERMKGFIELAWVFSTVLGLFLFLVEIAILCWVKFWDYSFIAAIAATVIVIPVLIVFVAFAVHFYHSLVVFKCEESSGNMEELENMKRNLDSTIKCTSPV